MSNCRFCDDWRDQRMVKYGARHYAHFKCYLDAGKTLDELPAWKVGEFPYRLLKERGLLDHPKVAEACAVATDLRRVR